MPCPPPEGPPSNTEASALGTPGGFAGEERLCWEEDDAVWLPRDPGMGEDQPPDVGGEKLLGRRLLLVAVKKRNS